MAAKDTKNTGGEASTITLKKASLVGWGSCMLVLLIVFFLLGTLVGRGMIRVDLGQDGIALELQGLAEAENNAALEEMDQVPTQSPDFVFYKALNKEVDKEKAAARPPAADKRKSVVKRDKHVVRPGASTAQKTVKPAEKAPIKAPTAPVKTAPAKKDPETFKYTIQAGSFKQPDDADKMVDRLKRGGYPAFWVKGLVRDNETWYRVRIGAYRDRMDAEATLSRLKQDNIDAFLVKR